MIRIPVTSSNLVSIGHEGTTLEVEFKHGGLYRYFNVPVDKYNALMSAESVGKFLNSEIKPTHGYEKIDTASASYDLETHRQQLDMDGVMIGVSRQALDEVLAELRYLRYFRDAAGDAFGPADGDVYWSINEDYAKQFGPVPAAYANEEG